MKATKADSLVSRDQWEHEARSWVAWARTEGFDSYWYYRQAFFDQ